MGLWKTIGNIAKKSSLLGDGFVGKSAQQAINTVIPGSGDVLANIGGGLFGKKRQERKSSGGGTVGTITSLGPFGWGGGDDEKKGISQKAIMIIGGIILGIVLFKKQIVKILK